MADALSILTMGSVAHIEGEEMISLWGSPIW